MGLPAADCKFLEITSHYWCQDENRGPQFGTFQTNRTRRTRVSGPFLARYRYFRADEFLICYDLYDLYDLAHGAGWEPYN